jgi:hypothetical protein
MDQATWDAKVNEGWQAMTRRHDDAPVGMSAADRAIYLADRPIFEAAARLEKFASETASLRAQLARLRLPLEAAEDRLDHTDDMLAIVCAQLERALAIVTAEIDRRQEANPEHYFAPMSPLAPANDDGSLEHVA